MIKPIDQLSFDEIVQIAAEGEQHQLEFKSASLLELNHTYNVNNGITSPKQLREKLRTVLGSKIGAFANSDGGFLIFGIDDRTGQPDGVIPEFWSAKTSTRDWLESVLKEALDPPLENFEITVVRGGTNQRLIIVSLPVSEKAPHQSAADFRYYVRMGNSAVPAGHWLIETIRNRKVHPRLEVKLLSSLCRFHDFKRVPNQDQGEAHLILSFRVVNAGEIIANRWAVSCECPFAKRPSLFQRTATADAESPPIVDGSLLLNLENPLFPSQAADFKYQMYCPVSGKWDGKQFLDFTWIGLDKLRPPARGHAPRDENRWFNLNITLHADSAPPVKCSLPIEELKFGPLLEKFIKDDSKRKIHMTDNWLAQINSNQRK